jgi:hypothetical protein
MLAPVPRQAAVRGTHDRACGVVSPIAEHAVICVPVSKIRGPAQLGGGIPLLPAATSRARAHMEKSLPPSSTTRGCLSGSGTAIGRLGGSVSARDQGRGATRDWEAENEAP